jgi:RNA polymerase primary sigma factor
MNEDAVRSSIAKHDFHTLFIEHLGWERMSGSFRADAVGTGYEIRRVAEKRGVQVLACILSRLAVRHRKLLRLIERAATRVAHEHILIHYSPDTAEQVWQWSVWTGDGAVFRHREHPFPSASPPKEFVKRLSLLEFTLVEEERTNIVDVLARITSGLDRTPDQLFFFRNPSFMAESDRLARDLKSGASEAVHRFIVYHRRLASWAAHRYLKTGIDPDDLQQIAMLGHLRAAQKFDPDRGFAFATYAVPWIRQFCGRFVPSHVLRLFMRPDQYWRMRHLLRIARKRKRRFGHDEAKLFLRAQLRSDRKVGRHFKKLRRALYVRSIDEPTDPAVQRWRRSPSTEPLPDQHAIELDELRVVLAAIDQLPSLDARIIRSRFGLGGPERTLAEIGADVGLSRERIRQRASKAFTFLREWTWPIVLGVPFTAGKDQGSESLDSLTQVEDGPPASPGTTSTCG